MVEYPIDGRLAQLGERILDVDEVSGSSPLSFTMIFKLTVFIKDGHFFYYKGCIERKPSL